MDNKRKLFVLFFVCLILFSVAPVFASTTTGEGSDNSTNDNNTINNTVVPPIADFTADVTNGTAPHKVWFTSNSTGNPTECSWIFGDGNYSNQNTVVSHTYTQPGKYEVLLTVTNAAGSSTAIKYINVSASVNTNINYSNASNVTQTAPCSCSMDNNSNNNNTNSNNTKSLCNVSNTVPNNLRVLCNGKAPNRVHFIDRSKRHISYYWDFGDGNTSRCKSITHIYCVPGRYLVKLTYKTTGHYTRTLYGGYIVVSGSSTQSSNNTSNSSQPTTANTSVTTSTPTLTPTPTPTPTPTTNSKVIASWAGSSTKNTETFHIPSNEWNISWDTKAGSLGNGIFSIIVYNSDGSYKDLVANVIGDNVDSTIERGVGDYYLKISSTQQYKIIIEQV